MVKEQLKTQVNLNIPQNNLNQASKLDSELSKKEYKPIPKSRQQIYQENYQKNKEKKKAQRRKRYQQQKVQPSKPTSTYNYSHYSQASDYQVLIPLKQYTELNKQKHKLWLDFSWNLKDCTEEIKEGLINIEAIMKLREVADNLVRDYWETAKSELKQRSRSWNSLTEEQQDRLIKYWGQQKVRWKNTLSHNLEKQEKRSKIFEREIKEMIGISLLHEERGMIKCSCWSCEKVKQEGRELLGIEEPKRKSKKRTKEECPNCGKLVKELGEENRVCKKCIKEYE